jgi:hypothetical protein
VVLGGAGGAVVGGAVGRDTVRVEVVAAQAARSRATAITPGTARQPAPPDTVRPLTGLSYPEAPPA